MNALVIDDSKVMRTIQKNGLGPLGFNDVAEAADGVEGLAEVSKKMPELILLDWNMPNMDGIEFITKFRELGHLTPVIMVTTEAEKSRVIQAIKAGVNNYLMKPFTPEQLKERVEQTLKAAA